MPIGKTRTTIRLFRYVVPIAVFLLFSIGPARNAGAESPREKNRRELSALKSRAAAGDKRAQLELGERYERGDGVPVDLNRAARLYTAAGSDSGGTTMMFVPQKNGSVSTVPTSSGPSIAGLPDALERLRTLCRTSFPIPKPCSVFADLPTLNNNKSSYYKNTHVLWYRISLKTRNNIHCLLSHQTQASSCDSIPTPNTIKYPAIHWGKTYTLGSSTSIYGGGSFCPNYICVNDNNSIELGNIDSIDPSKPVIMSVVTSRTKPVGVTLMFQDRSDGHRRTIAGTATGIDKLTEKSVKSVMPHIIEED